MRLLQTTCFQRMGARMIGLETISPRELAIPVVMLLEEAAEVGVGGIEDLEAALGSGAAVEAGDTLVLAQVEGENSASGCRRVAGGGRVHGTNSCRGSWCWEIVIPFKLPRPPRLAWILSAKELHEAAAGAFLLGDGDTRCG
jgi:hypothetical protein